MQVSPGRIIITRGVLKRHNRREAGTAVTGRRKLSKKRINQRHQVGQVAASKKANCRENTQDDDDKDEKSDDAETCQRNGEAHR